MAERPDFKKTDRYADRLQRLLLPDALPFPAPLMSASTTESTYTYLLPDDRMAVMKIAIPEAYLDRDDARETHERTVETIAREAVTIRELKEGIKNRARFFESEQAERGPYGPPSIWIPEVYFSRDGILIREFMSGQIVSSASDLTVAAALRYSRDLMTVSEGLGYAGWKAVEMRGDVPHNPRELEISTRLLKHRSPHVDDVVLSPLGFAHLRHLNDPGSEFRKLQNEDFRQAAWLVAMAQAVEAYDPEGPTERTD